MAHGLGSRVGGNGVTIPQRSWHDGRLGTACPVLADSGRRSMFTAWLVCTDGAPMSQRVILLSSGATGILALAYYGYVWRDEDWRVTAAVFCFILSLVSGAHCLVTSSPPISGAPLRAVTIGYWLSFVIFGAFAIWTFLRQ